MAVGNHNTHLHPHTQQAPKMNLGGLGLRGRGKAVCKTGQILRPGTLFLLLYGLGEEDS